jgi:hypothetical protein
MKGRRTAWAAAAIGVITLGVAAAPSFGGSSGVHFGKPIVVDKQLAGGEPSIFWDPFHQDYIYSSHEGTTHTLRDGLGAPSGTSDVASNYRNQVNIWTSRNGVSWQRVNLDGTGFEANPTTNTGFSDPDLTQDDAGRVYDTGIDLVNDALFSSGDGGLTWDKGTINCHDGDRPWLAAGPKDVVWLADDPEEQSHTVWQSTDGGSNCGANGIQDPVGYGKLVYDQGKNPALHGAIIEPAPQVQGGIGVSILKNALKAYASGTGAFVPHPVAPTQGLLTHFPSLATDSYGNLYLSWTDYPGGTSGSGKNTVWLSMSKDGVHWTAPYSVSHPGTTVLWPWVTAGTPGNVSVVWYQYDRPTPDPDQATTGNVSVMEASLFGFGTKHVTKTVVNASGKPIHVGGICQGGTTCVATGQDRRLGDYFTNYIDGRGCIIIASGSTMINDAITGGEKAWSTPIFLRQDGGKGLTGKSCSASSGRGSAIGGMSDSSGRAPLAGFGLLLLMAPVVLRARTRLAAALHRA